MRGVHAKHSSRSIDGGNEFLLLFKSGDDNLHLFHLRPRKFAS